MQQGICYIVGASGERPDAAFAPRAEDFIIAADAGYDALRAVGIAPDLTVGDFDSLDWIPKGDNVICHPVMKDDTDMMLAVKQGLERGYRVFLIYGGLGGRLDHSIANIQTLAYIAQHGGRGYLIGQNETATVLRNDRLEFRDTARGLLSVFAQGAPAEGVTLEGLLYPLRNATLTPEYPLGVSNEFIGEAAAVSVQNGMLTVVWRCPFELAIQI